MRTKRIICIVTGVLMLLAAALYFVLLMPQNAMDEHERLELPVETAEEETSVEEVSGQQKKEAPRP